MPLPVGVLAEGHVLFLCRQWYLVRGDRTSTHSKTENPSRSVARESVNRYLVAPLSIKVTIAKTPLAK